MSKNKIERGNSLTSSYGEIEPLALRIPSIIGNCLFHYLSVDDLKQCRKVCRLWTEEGTKVLAPRSKYHLKGEKQVSQFLQAIEDSNNVTKVGSVTSVQLKLSTSPTVKETAFSSNGIPTSLIDTEEVTRLFEKIGPKIIELELLPLSWSCQSLLELIYLKVPNLENLCIHYVAAGNLAKAIKLFGDLETLKKADLTLSGGTGLKIKQFAFHYDSGQEDTTVDSPEPKLIRRYIITELFKRMPMLKKFSCNDVFVREDFLYYCIIASANTENNPLFSEFDFPINLNEDEVKKFHERLKYPLESLDLSLRPGLRFPALYTFLSSLGSTLKTLKLDFKFLSQQTETFPCGTDLVNLKNLTFKHYNGSLDFIHFTVNLKSLTLINANLSVTFRGDGKFDFDTPHGLKSLKVYNGHSNAGRFSFPDIFRNMAKLFPKLRKFRMEYLTDTTLKIISEGFKDLEALFIENSIVSDIGIVEHLPKMKNLNTLVLNSVKISNASFKGIILCKELRSLSLNSPMITGIGLKEIIPSLNLYHLVLKDCYRIDNLDICDIEKLLLPGASIKYS